MIDKRRKNVKKTTCILFSTHHNANNIASIRYRSLIKYINSDKYEFIIVTKAIDNETKIITNGNVTVIPVIGTLFGQASVVNNVKTLIYFLFGFDTTSKRGLLNSINSFNNCWTKNAIKSLENHLELSKCRGAKVAMGSYSPIDALIATSKFAKKHNVNFIQDFRDGFLFESLGRKSRLLDWVRQRLETIACHDSSLIMSVSTPLVDDFKSRYPNKVVKLLHNGFDPDDFSSMNVLDEDDELLNALFSDEKKVIGHFGRISASDASRWDSLQSFLTSVSQLDSHIKSQHRLLFMGELEAREIELIKSLDIEFIISKPVAREEAIGYMSKCHYLLLLTGNSVGCATGKVFEYINTNKKIICFTGIENEATKILQETSTGKSFVNKDEFLVKHFENHLQENQNILPNKSEFEKYNKINQAKFLENIFDSLICNVKN